MKNQNDDIFSGGDSATPFHGRLSVVRVTGDDAARIVNNLTTADIARLNIGDAAETFVTEVRGRTLGHVTLSIDDGGLWMIGPPGQSEAIVGHIDRYTIREDCTAKIQDERIAMIAPPSSAGTSPTMEQSAWTIQTSIQTSIQTTWLGSRTVVTLIDAAEGLLPPDIRSIDGADFHDARIHAGFPWWGVDFTDKNLPQEVNRDHLAISFTKGCYLGQETVARLDALGQVQKKLVRLSIQSGEIQPGDKLVQDDKPVARITSVTSDQKFAFAMVRRAWFDPGTEANAVNDRTADSVSAVVLK